MANPLYLPVSLSESIASFGLATPATQALANMTTPFNNNSNPMDGAVKQRQAQSDHRPIDSYRYTAHQDQTTLVLGVINYLERVESEIAEMKDFINLGFKRIETIGQTDRGMAVTIEE